MKEKRLVYEKKYIFVDGVRIPLAFMDCNEIRETSSIISKLSLGSLHSQEEVTETSFEGDETELIDERM